MNHSLLKIKQMCRFCLLMAVLLGKGSLREVAAGSVSDNGSSPDSPIPITDVDGLKSIKDGLDKHYKLANDITLTEAWSISLKKEFTGSLDGDGHKITGFYMEDETGLAALFYSLSGTIKNLGIEIADGKSISGTSRVAGIVLTNNQGTIQNCYVKGKEIKGAQIGGIVVENNGTVENCLVMLESMVNIANGNLYMGGIAAFSSNDNISHCMAFVKSMILQGDLQSYRHFGNIAGNPKAPTNVIYSDIMTDNYVYYGLKLASKWSFSGKPWNGALEAGWDSWSYSSPTLTLKMENSKSVDFGLIDYPSYLSQNNGAYEIKDKSDLIKLSDYTNNGGNSSEGMAYVLVNDIDLSGEDFLPIGGAQCDVSSYNHHFFKGSLDGQGHIISNLKFDRVPATKLGLFQFLDGATVKNLGLKNCEVAITLEETDKARDYFVGGIAGAASNGSIIENCFVTGSFKFTGFTDRSMERCYMGGITATTYGGEVISNGTQIKNCYTDVSLSATSRTCLVGGIAGTFTKNNVVESCCVKGNIEIDSNNFWTSGIGNPSNDNIIITVSTCLVLCDYIKMKFNYSYCGRIASYASSSTYKDNYVSKNLLFTYNDTPVDLNVGANTNDGANWKGEKPDDSWSFSDDNQFMYLTSLATTFGDNYKEMVRLSDYLQESITIASSVTKGTITTEPADEAMPDSKVKINVVPDAGYKLTDGSLTITDEDAEPVTLTCENGNYSFTMPSKAVTITAEFEIAPLDLSAITAGNQLKVFQDGSQWWYQVAGQVSPGVWSDKIPFTGVITGTLEDGKVLSFSGVCADEIRFESATVSTIHIEDGACIVLDKTSSLNYTTLSNAGGTLIAVNGANITATGSDYINKVTIATPSNGVLDITAAGIALSDGDALAQGSKLIVSATPNNGYKTGSIRVVGKSGGSQTEIGGEYTMPKEAITVSASFEVIYTPPVYYTVTLPALEGATTDPAAGRHEVESWDTFRFYLTLEPEYSESQPVVTTSRGETILPRTSDGAYLLKYVRTDVEVFIDGIVKNAPPVANDPIRTESSLPAIWSENGSLYVRLPEGLGGGATGGTSSGSASLSDVRIFTPAGRLLYAFRSVPGLNRWQLPTGLYIIQVGDTVRKVLIR